MYSLDMGEYVSTKRFTGFTCTHRHWNNEGQCRYVHGYAREFYIEFRCRERTKEGFVMDFGGLAQVQSWLGHMYDHTFLSAPDDPCMDTWQKLDNEGQIQLRVVPEVGIEGTAKLVYQKVVEILHKLEGGRVWPSKVEVIENYKNSSFYIPDSKEENT